MMAWRYLSQSDRRGDESLAYRLGRHAVLIGRRRSVIVVVAAQVGLLARARVLHGTCRPRNVLALGHQRVPLAVATRIDEADRAQQRQPTRRGHRDGSDRVARWK